MQSPRDSVSEGWTSARLCGPQDAVGPETRGLCGLGPAPGYPKPGLGALGSSWALLLEALELCVAPGCVEVSSDNTALLGSLQPCLDFPLKRPEAGPGDCVRGRSPG